MTSRLLKRLISGALALTLVFSINGFASVVTDNDGSAFITKAEFDSLKNSFQAQIDSYNQAIDSKIDGAIAAYLAGIRISTSTVIKTLCAAMSDEGILSINKENPLDYKLTLPKFWGRFSQTNQKVGTNISGCQVEQIYTYNAITSFGTNNKGKKTVIDSLDTTKSIAKWYGYCENCTDVVFSQSAYTDSTTGANMSMVNMWEGGSIGCLVQTPTYQNVDLVGQNYNVMNCKGFDSAGNFVSRFWWRFYTTSITHDWGLRKNKYISISKNFDYDMFSNKERDYNWGYQGNYVTKLNGYDNTWVCPSEIKSTGGGWDFCNDLISSDGFNYTGIGTEAVAAGKVNTVKVDTNGILFDPNHFYKQNAGTYTHHIPIVGFERAYLTNWNCIYMDAWDDLAKSIKNASSGSLPNTLLIGNDNQAHLSVAAGIPLCELPKNCKIERLILTFDGGPTDKYNIWIKSGPFTSGDPDNETCLTFTETPTFAKDATKNNAYVATGTTVNVKTEITLDDDSVLFIKWAKINPDDRTKDGGGTLFPPREMTIINVD